MFADILNAQQQQTLADNRQLDMGYSRGKLRFRINIYYERNQPAMAIRWLDGSFRSLSELNLPKACAFGTFKRWLVNYWRYWQW